MNNNPPVNKKTLEQVNIEVTSKYPELRFLEYIASKTPSTIINTRCGHTWLVRPEYVIKRDIGFKCPICHVSTRKKSPDTFNADILTKFPSIHKILDAYKNSTTRLNVEYQCKHIGSIVPADLLNKGAGKECRICTPQRYSSKSHETFKLEVQNINDTLILLEPYTGDNGYILIGSELCQHTWHINPHNFLAKGTNSDCPTCCPNTGTSIPEIELLDFIKDNYSGWVEVSDRSILEGRELDIVLPDLGLAIEFNGVYWHSDKHKPSYYHKEKTDLVQDFGYRLIHIMEDEWNQKRDIVQSRLLGYLGKHKGVYARNCVIQEESFSNISAFLNSNHIQGAGSPTKYNFSLRLKGEIIAVMSFNTPRFTDNYNFELVRYCSSLNTRVIGGASRLLKAFLNKVGKDVSIISYSDRRWNTGTLYLALGFKRTHTSSPNYAYYSGTKDRISRYACQKHKLKTLFPSIYKDELTEEHILKKAGYHRVYDSGNDVFVRTP